MKRNTIKQVHTEWVHTAPALLCSSGVSLRYSSVSIADPASCQYCMVEPPVRRIHEIISKYLFCSVQMTTNLIEN